MAARMQAGLTAASLPFVAGLAFVESNSVAAAVAFSVAAVVALLTFAPQLPFLHRLPRIGSPRITARFIRVERNELVEGFPFPMNGAYLQIEPKVSSRIEDAVLGFFAPEGVSIENIDLGGTPTSKGRLLLPTDDQLNPGRRSQHWSDHAELRRGDGLMLFIA